MRLSDDMWAVSFFGGGALISLILVVAGVVMLTVNPFKTKEPTMQIQLLTDTAHTPVRGSEHAAGWDLYADQDGQLIPGANALISTGVALAMPPNIHGLIWPRSGLAARHKLAVLAGVIDNDYRGEIRVNLVNLGTELYEFRRGDRIAQILFQETAPKITFEQVPRLPITARGTKSFGSSGT